eukprot:905022-Rhodomonas_salina.1
MPTCFDEESEAFVDAIVAKYLVTGVVEWYPAHSKPLAICPIGTVPKKTVPFRRLVVDSRGPNECVSRWPSNMKSLAASGHLFEPGAVVFTLDIGKAYVVSKYQGCMHRWTER